MTELEAALTAAGEIATLLQTLEQKHAVLVSSLMAHAATLKTAPSPGPPPPPQGPAKQPEE